MASIAHSLRTLQATFSWTFPSPPNYRPFSPHGPHVHRPPTRGASLQPRRGVRRVHGGDEGCACHVRVAVLPPLLLCVYSPLGLDQHPLSRVPRPLPHAGGAQAGRSGSHPVRTLVPVFFHAFSLRIRALFRLFHVTARGKTLGLGVELAKSLIFSTHRSSKRCSIHTAQRALTPAQPRDADGAHGGQLARPPGAGGPGRAGDSGAALPGCGGVRCRGRFDAGRFHRARQRRSRFGLGSRRRQRRRGGRRHDAAGAPGAASAARGASPGGSQPAGAFRARGPGARGNGRRGHDGHRPTRPARERRGAHARAGTGGRAAHHPIAGRWPQDASPHVAARQ